jgi:GH25 family lysozyme M1 (1,4-beta-N-acetylmuramidase)
MFVVSHSSNHGVFAMTTLKLPCFADSSHWNPVDWNNLDPNVLGMIWKITQGKYYIDPTCAGFWKDAKSKGISRSVFHFFEPNDIAAQVENFLTACEDHGIIVAGKWMAEIEPVLDAEYTPPAAIPTRVSSAEQLPRRKKLDLQFPELYLETNPRLGVIVKTKTAGLAVTGATLAAQYKTWLDMVEAEVNIKPIIYTSKWMWIHTGFPAWAKDYQLWDAQYPNNPDGQNAPLYVPYGNFPGWWGWQYSANMVISGFSGDINVYNGTTEQWKSKYGGGVIPPEPPIGETMNEVTVVWDAGANVRSAPNTYATIIKTLADNTVLQTAYSETTDASGNRWIRISEAQEYIATFYGSTLRASVVPIVVPPVTILPTIHVTITGEGYPNTDIDIAPL